MRPILNHLGEWIQLFVVWDNTLQEKYRIYTNVCMSLKQMKYIAQQINSPFIDLQVYKVGGSIRLPNSFKYDWKKKQFIERYYKVSKEDFMRCIVNYIDDCIIFTDSISLNID